ncbi:MAG: phospholipid carrier-dependent glycosyltransferase [Gaiellales bacterium]
MRPLVWAAGLPGRAVGLVLRHRLFTLLLVAGAALRALVWAAYQPALFYYGDSYFYLGSTLRLRPNPVRPIAYPAVLDVLLRVGDLAVVPAVQHLFGLITAVLCYALLRRLGAGSVVASLAGAAPVLFDGYLIDIEQYVLAEGLFIVLMMAGLALLVWRSRPSPAVCVLAGGLLATASLTRTVGMVLIVPVLVYCVLRWFGMLRIVLVTAGFVLPLAAYATWFDATWGMFAVTRYDGYFLYGRVSSFANCADWHVTPAQRPYCFGRPPAQRHNPNYYVWAEWGRRHHHRPFLLDSRLRSFSLAVIEHQPVAYASTILGDLVHYSSPGHWTNRFDTPSTDWRFPSHLRKPHLKKIRRDIRRFGGHVGVDRSLAGLLRAYQAVVFVQGPLLAAAFLAALAAAAVGRPAGERRLRAEALLFALVGLALPTTAAATTMFDYRYALVSIPPLAVGMGIAILVAESRLRAWRARERPAGPACERVAAPAVEAESGVV